MEAPYAGCLDGFCKSISSVIGGSNVVISLTPFWWGIDFVSRAAVVNQSPLLLPLLL